MSRNLQKCQHLAVSLKSHMFRQIILNLRFLHNGPDNIEELLDRHLVKKEKSLDDEEEELLNQRRVSSTRREALQLYRDILRATRFFMWPDQRGVLWRDILRENARKEFEAARFETDPEVVTRLLIGGRDAVESALEKLAEKSRQQIEKECNADEELQQTIRQEFEKNRDCNDKQKIRYLLSEGFERLKGLDEMLDMQGH